MQRFKSKFKLFLWAAFLLCLTLPLFLTVPIYIQLIANSLVLVSLGSLYSINIKHNNRDKTGDENDDRLSLKDAIKFPIVAGGVLLLLYILFQNSEGDLLLMLFRGQFSIMGAGAIGMFFNQISEEYNELWPKKVYIDKNMTFLGDKYDVYLSNHNICGYSIGAVLGVVYFFTNHWILNNIIGAVFTVLGIAFIKVGHFYVVLVLHWLLFLYDIFFVFGTEVMVSVATKMDVPIKLKLPLAKGFSILGLGDLVIPGILSALSLKFDVDNALEEINKKNEGSPDLERLETPFFNYSLVGYFLGISATVWGMVVMNSGQPALLYLVPAMSLTLVVCAVRHGKVKALFGYSAEPEKETEKEKKEGK